MMDFVQDFYVYLLSQILFLNRCCVRVEFKLKFLKLIRLLKVKAQVKANICVNVRYLKRLPYEGEMKE